MVGRNRQEEIRNATKRSDLDEEKMVVGEERVSRDLYPFYRWFERVTGVEALGIGCKRRLKT
jgi:hypothetical protein